MTNKWTKEQQAVIDSRNCNLLVSAAAGSGKTAVLIERIIQLILDKEKPIDIDRLLVVTFTKAAASEMRERVGVAIEEALEKEPENERLQKQMMLLNKAEITTIDSFCGNVVRENFHVTDLDPNVKVADPTEINIVASEVMDDMFEELYEEENEDFLKLVDWYSGNNNDSPLSELLMSVYNFISSSPFPLEWLDNSAEFFNTEGKDEDFYYEKYVKFWAEDTAIYVKYVLNIVKGLLDEISIYPDLEKYYSNFKSFFDCVEEVYKNIVVFIEEKDKKSWNVVRNSIEKLKSVPTISFKSSKKFDPMALSIYDEVKTVLRDYRKKINEILDSINLDVDYIKDECGYIYPYMRAISNIVDLFTMRFSEKKKRMGVLDFSDIEHYALNILTDTDENGNIIPSKIAQSYREKYEEVFTDEYQDSNMVQEIILSQVSREDYPNRFMVGDVKQSIYRFRQAMPEIFMQKYMDYDEVAEGETTKNRKIMLYKNFRSRAEVLQGCNHIFSSIMNKTTGELDYTIEESLNPSAYFEELDCENAHVGGPIEIYLVDKSKKSSDGSEIFGNQGGDSILDSENSEEKYQSSNFEGNDFEDESVKNGVNSLGGEDLESKYELDSFETEAANIANIIYKMVNGEKLIVGNESNKSRFMVFDKKTKKYRAVEYRDIVILLRAPGQKAGRLEKILLDLNIPVYSDVGNGYFSTLEVSTMVNLLKIIDNPFNDIELISVMKSPIFNFNPDELTDIRLCNRRGNFYEAVLSCIEKSQDLYAESDFNKKISDNLCKKVSEFINKIEEYRKKSHLMSVDDFIWYLLEETNYYNYVGMLPMGEQRQGNLMLLFERARQYENTSYKGLFNFINYFERIKNRSGDLGEAKSISEEANVVRILSIHKSKGLEFPVVILANSEKAFRLDSNKTRLTLNQKYGFGPVVYNLDKNYRYNSYMKNIIDKIQVNEQIAEEMRILYVAMTRAKEKLIITGSVKNYEESLKKWTGNNLSINGEIDSYSVLSKRSYLEWIMPVIVGMEERESFFTVTGEEKKYIGYKDCKWSIDVVGKGEILSTKNELETIESSFDDLKPENMSVDLELSEDTSVVLDDELINFEKFIEDKISFRYAFENSANKPSSMSVSEVKKMMMQDDEDMHKNIYEKRYSPDLKIPDFMHKGENAVKYNAAERGTIFHMVMQLLDFKKFDIENKESDLIDTSKIENEVISQLESFVEDEIMSVEEKSTVDISWITKFICTDIFSQMQKADRDNKLFKEKAIDYSISINQIYRDEDIVDSEKMMLVGIIDLFFEDENGDIILLDYKTDKVSENNRDEVVSRYKVQLELYKKALEKISGRKVVKKYIYLFSSGELVEYE